MSATTEGSRSRPTTKTARQARIVALLTGTAVRSQAELAQLLKTSQSAVTRIEAGRQNLSLDMLARIGDALDSEFVSVGHPGPQHLRIVGGRKLSGSIDVKTSKNAAVALLCASLVNRGRTTLRKVARIEEVNRLLEVLESLGVQTRWLNEDNDLEIIPPVDLKLDAIDEAAARLASILRAEEADVLVTYDPAGGYGHRDHVHAHRVGMRAGELAGTAHVLQATVPRDLLVRALRLVRRVYRFPAGFDFAAFERAFSPRAAITHRIDVGRYAGAKRASMAAHASQASADEGDRTLQVFLRFPRPLFRLVFAREWYVEPARPRRGGPVRRDIFG